MYQCISNEQARGEDFRDKLLEHDSTANPSSSGWQGIIWMTQENSVYFLHEITFVELFTDGDLSLKQFIPNMKTWNISPGYSMYLCIYKVYS